MNMSPTALLPSLPAVIAPRRELAQLRSELSALVDSAACACMALLQNSFLAPYRLEPPQLSGDEEHIWIGLNG